MCFLGHRRQKLPRLVSPKFWINNRTCRGREIQMKMKVDCKSYTAAVGFTDSSRTGELSD